MSAGTTSEQAIVLSVAPSGESFQKLHLLSAESGVFLTLKRISRKKNSTTAADLFDTAEVLLESSKQGTLRFVADYRLIHRRSAIGKSYLNLQAASEFCALLALNGPHMADAAALFQLTKRTLDAFVERSLPEVVLFKAIYLLLRDEGYPVKEAWWPEIPRNLKPQARELLTRPTPDQISPESSAITATLLHSLLLWLRRETDFLLPKNFPLRERSSAAVSAPPSRAKA